ncbi:carbon-nitrogen family hydrolase [Bacillus kexueae]|uniref:carbon-nitrogen family hydrolase n=1 Tax=Aeribacillus kexueae TaxID=2078952 RepID=UPI001FAF39F4|nr:carbon-nitrogen family hydrolase [Bacillus kexueae]
MKWRVSCLQSDIAFGHPEQNFIHFEKQIEKATKEEKASVVVLPELWTTGYDLTNLDTLADHDGQLTKSILINWAKKYNVHLIGGSIAKAKQSGVYNTTYVVSSEGAIIHEYSKLHLFRLMDEHLYLQEGKDEALFTLDAELCASFICYDLRFPEWIRKSTTKGAKVLFFVAEWPAPRLHHWRSLLIARAIENQCYVVACNRVGRDPNNVFAGHSMIVDPWGEVIAEGGNEEEIVTADINFDTVNSVRKQIPIFDDRRPSVY